MGLLKTLAGLFDLQPHRSPLDDRGKHKTERQVCEDPRDVLRPYAAGFGCTVAYGTFSSTGIVRVLHHGFPLIELRVVSDGEHTVIVLEPESFGSPPHRLRWLADRQRRYTRVKAYVFRTLKLWNRERG